MRACKLLLRNNAINLLIVLIRLVYMQTHTNVCVFANFIYENKCYNAKYEMKWLIMALPMKFQGQFSAYENLMSDIPGLSSLPLNF